MSLKIKKILLEYSNEKIINKVYDLVKDEFYLYDGKVKTNIWDSDGHLIEPDSRSGINIQLKKGGYFNEIIVEYLMHSFGLDYKSAEKVYDLISYGLKRENAIYRTPNVLFNDFFQFSNYPSYKIDMRDLNYLDSKLKIVDLNDMDSFKKLIKWHKLKIHDAHSETSYDITDTLTENDYLYIRNELIDLIDYANI